MSTYIVRFDTNQYKQWLYPAGEIGVRFHPEEVEKIKKADVIIVIPNAYDSPRLMELMHVKDVLDDLAPNTTKFLILAYLPYSRADRRFTEGEAFGLRAFSKFLNLLNFDSICTLDAHSPVSTNLIDHLADLSVNPYIKKTIIDIATQGKSGTYDINVLFPDEGAKLRYNLPDKYEGNVCTVNINKLHAEKKRDPETGKLSGFQVPERTAFKNAPIVVVDDICDGGGTFIGIGDALAGYDLHLALYVTTGIFSKGFSELMLRYQHIYTTNSFDGYYASKKDTTVYDAVGDIIEMITKGNVWGL